MKFEDFSMLIQYSDRRFQFDKYYEEHVALFRIAEQFLNVNEGIDISIKEKENNCSYFIAATYPNADLSFIASRINGIKIPAMINGKVFHAVATLHQFNLVEIEFK